ncbi:hypothetical protein AGDE_14062 [Angomonas deanei]|nr:hypothetical protein AGDE_14062 [Angomonas deanei]|eukprot:EPY21497.1 hypothetical protein AGDE_14062 [Angomonas deanei]
MTVALFETKELVRSAVWHPSTAIAPCLILLLDSGDVHLYDARFHLLGVMLPRAKQFSLLDYLPPKDPYVPSTETTPALGAKALGGDIKQIAAHPPVVKPKSTATRGKALGARNAFGIRETPAIGDVQNIVPLELEDKEEGKENVLVVQGKKGSETLPLVPVSPSPVIDTGRLMRGTATVPTTIPQPPPGPELLKINVQTKDDDGEGELVYVSTPAVTRVDPLDMNIRESSDFVSIAVVPPSRSNKSGVLLALTTRGAVYSCKIDGKGVPNLNLSDGKLNHHSFLSGVLFAVVAPVEEDIIALSLQCALIDADSELYAMVSSFSDGTVRVALVKESLLIAPPSSHSSSPVASYRTTVHLGEEVDVGSTLSVKVPSATHLVQFDMVGNVALLRYNDPGDTFLFVLPLWSSSHGGWTYDRNLTEKGGKHQPPGLIVSYGGEMPLPLSLRLPFATRDKSVALSKDQILITPCESEETPSGDQLVIVNVVEIIRTAMYASMKSVERQPAAEHSRDELWKEVDRCYEVVLPCQKSFLKRDYVKAEQQLEQCYTQLESTTRKVNRYEGELEQKRERLYTALNTLQSDVHSVCEGVAHDREVLLSAIVHRRGRVALESSNEKLAEIHGLLKNLERLVSAPQK